MVIRRILWQLILPYRLYRSFIESYVRLWVAQVTSHSQMHDGIFYDRCDMYGSQAHRGPAIKFWWNSTWYWFYVSCMALRYVEKWQNNCLWVVFIIGVVLNFEVVFVHWILSTFYVFFIYWVIFILWVCPIVNFVIQRATILKIEKNLIRSVAIVQCDTMLYNRVGYSWGHKQVDTGTVSYVYQGSPRQKCKYVFETSFVKFTSTKCCKDDASKHAVNNSVFTYDLSFTEFWF